jgi:hypothetical protein
VARASRASAKVPKGHTLADLLQSPVATKGGSAKDVESLALQMQPQIKRVLPAHLNTPLADLSPGTLRMTVDDQKPKSALRPSACGSARLARWQPCARGRPAAAPRRQSMVASEVFGAGHEAK